MANLPGITEQTSETPQPNVEDTKFSISHLLIHGVVTKTITRGEFAASFTSLTTAQSSAVDDEVISLKGPMESRAANNLRNLKIVSRSLNGVVHSGGDFELTRGPKSLEEMEKVLQGLSAFVFNTIFSLYVEFEKDVSKLLSGADIKNS